MIIVDANILVSTVAGKHTRRVVRDAATRGLTPAAPLAQAEEAVDVMKTKISFDDDDARRPLDEVLCAIRPL